MSEQQPDYTPDSPAFLAVDPHGPDSGGPQYVRVDAIILVAPWMQMGKAPAPIPGVTTTQPREAVQRGSTVRLIDGTTRTIDGKTPEQIVAVCAGRVDLANHPDGILAVRRGTA